MNYSNFAFGVLDHVIARVGEQDYRTWIVREVLDPLGMTHTDVGVRSGKDDHAAIGYRRQGGRWTKIDDYGFDHDGASAIRSSAKDLMRFARLHMDVAPDRVDGAVLSSASLRTMRDLTGSDAGSSFGIGWSVGRLRGRAVLRHSGGMPGVSTQLVVMPEDRIAVAVLTNGGNRGATNRALTAILDCLPEATDEAGSDPATTIANTTAHTAAKPTDAAPGKARSPAASPAASAAPSPREPLGPGAWRGVLVHPDGPIPLALTATRSPQAEPPATSWRLRTGDSPPAHAQLQSSPYWGPLSLRARADLDVGHGDRRAESLLLQLDRTDGGLAGVGYADAPAVCRLPFWCEMQREEPKPAGTLRVVSYNVLVGMRDSEVGRFLPGFQRRAKIAAWLAAQQPDVVALQEMCGFTQASLTKLAAAWGHRHVALLKENGFPVALTSTAPIEVVARHRDGLHHGMLHATTHGTDFVVVHYKPHPGTKPKLRESELALQCYRKALAAGRECLVLGDFNSVHPIDVYRFSDAARERYEKWRYLVRDDVPAETAIEPLLAAGLVDTFAARGDIPKELPLPRIDFVLASSKLMAACSTSRWVCDTERLRWSDHPPTVADFAWPTATGK